MVSTSTPLGRLVIVIYNHKLEERNRMRYRISWTALAALVMLATGLTADPISRYKNDEPNKLGDHGSILVLRLRVINRTPARDIGPIFRYQSEPKGDTWHSVLWRFDDRLPDDAKGNSDAIMYAKVVPGRYDLRGYCFDYGRFTNYLDFLRTMVVPPDSLIVGQAVMEITSYNERAGSFSFNSSFAMDDSVRQDLLARFAAKCPATAARFKGREVELNSFPLTPWPAQTPIYRREFAQGAVEWPLADDAGQAITCDGNGYSISGLADRRAAA